MPTAAVAQPAQLCQLIDPRSLRQASAYASATRQASVDASATRQWMYGISWVLGWRYSLCLISRALSLSLTACGLAIACQVQGTAERTRRSDFNTTTISTEKAGKGARGLQN